MKKTVTVNIGGIAFTIDEDAFSKLNTYLETIKSYFKASEGREEIMQDIENRIAEMLSEKLSNHKQVISLNDIENIISIMGQPEDYIDSTDNTTEHEKKQERAQREHKQYEEKKFKRIYRDGDGNVIGGVCSGIGYYFGFDPLWLRLAFALSFFFLGSGFLLYIILWLVLPKAVTAAEKLEMKGKPITFDNIGKTVEEELHNLKKKVDEFEEELKSPNAKKIQTQFLGIVQKVIHFFIEIVKNILRFVGKVVGLFLLFFGSIFLLVLLGVFLGNSTLISITSNGTNTIQIVDTLNLFFTSVTHSWILITSLAILVGIPLLALIFLGIRLIFGLKHHKRGIGAAFGVLWIIGIVLCVFVGLTTLKDFTQKGKVEKNTTLETLTGDTLYLGLKPDIFEQQNVDRNFDELFLFKQVEDTLYFGYPTLNIVKSENEYFRVEVTQTAYSGEYKQAIYRAEQIHYDYTLTDNALVFNPYYSVVNEQWRNQRVYITIHVPVGKSIYMDKKMTRIIYDIKNVTNTLDHEMIEKVWVMTENGLVLSK